MPHVFRIPFEYHENPVVRDFGYTKYLSQDQTGSGPFVSLAGAGNFTTENFISDYANGSGYTLSKESSFYSDQYEDTGTSYSSTYVDANQVEVFVYGPSVIQRISDASTLVWESILGLVPIATVTLLHSVSSNSTYQTPTTTNGSFEIWVGSTVAMTASELAVVDGKVQTTDYTYQVPTLATSNSTGPVDTTNTTTATTIQWTTDEANTSTYSYGAGLRDASLLALPGRELWTPISDAGAVLQDWSLIGSTLTFTPPTYGRYSFLVPSFEISDYSSSNTAGDLGFNFPSTGRTTVAYLYDASSIKSAYTTSVQESINETSSMFPSPIAEHSTVYNWQSLADQSLLLFKDPLTTQYWSDSPFTSNDGSSNSTSVQAWGVQPTIIGANTLHGGQLDWIYGTSGASSISHGLAILAAFEYRDDCYFTGIPGYSGELSTVVEGVTSTQTISLQESRTEVLWPIDLNPNATDPRAIQYRVGGHGAITVQYAVPGVVPAFLVGSDKVFTAFMRGESTIPYPFYTQALESIYGIDNRSWSYEQSTRIIGDSGRTADWAYLVSMDTLAATGLTDGASSRIVRLYWTNHEIELITDSDNPTASTVSYHSAETGSLALTGDDISFAGFFSRQDTSIHNPIRFLGGPADSRLPAHTVFVGYGCFDIYHRTSPTTTHSGDTASTAGEITPSRYLVDPGTYSSFTLASGDMVSFQPLPYLTTDFRESEVRGFYHAVDLVGYPDQIKFYTYLDEKVNGIDYTEVNPWQEYDLMSGP